MTGIMDKQSAQKFCQLFIEKGYDHVDDSIVASYNRIDTRVIVGNDQEQKYIIKCKYLPITTIQLQTYIKKAKNLKLSKELTNELLTMGYCQWSMPDEKLIDTHHNGDHNNRRKQENNNEYGNEPTNLYEIINQFILESLSNCWRASISRLPYIDEKYTLAINNRTDTMTITEINNLERIQELPQINNNKLTVFEELRMAEKNQKENHDETKHNDLLESKPKTDTINVLKIWDKNRDQIDQRKMAEEMIKIMLETETTGWQAKFEKTDYVKNLLINNHRSKDEQNSPLYDLQLTLPDFISEQQTDVANLDYQKFISAMITWGTKPSETGLQSTEMKKAIENLSKVFKLVFSKIREKWTKKIAAEIDYLIIIDKKEKTMKYDEVIKVCFGSLFMTVYFYCTTADPKCIKLDDYPSNIRPKTAKSALTMLRDQDIDDEMGLKMALSNASSHVYAEKMDGHQRAKTIIRTFLDRGLKMIEDSDGDWTDETKQSNSVLVNVLMQEGDKNPIIKILENIFKSTQKKTDAKQMSVIVELFEQANAQALADGAKTIINLSILKQFAKFVADNEKISSSIKDMEKEAIQKEFKSADIAGRIMGAEAMESTSSQENYPPPLVYENQKPIKFTPRIWNSDSDGPLNEHIRDKFIPELQTQGIMSRANCIKMIYHILPTKNCRNRFGRIYLDKLGDDAVLSTDEFSNLINSISSEFDQSRTHYRDYYRSMLYNPESARQQPEEDIRTYVDRVRYMVKKAFPDSYDSPTEQCSVVRSVFAGLADKRIKNHLMNQHAKLVSRGSDSEELLTVMLTFQEEQRLMSEMGSFFTPNKKGGIFNFNNKNENSFNKKGLNNKNSFNNNSYNDNNNNYNNKSKSFNNNRFKQKTYSTKVEQSQSQSNDSIDNYDGLFRKLFAEKCKDYNLDDDGDYIIDMNNVEPKVARSRNFKLADYVFNKKDLRKIIQETKAEVQEYYDQQKNNDINYVQDNHDSENNDSQSDDHENYDNDSPSYEEDECNLHGLFDLK